MADSNLEAELKKELNLKNYLRAALLAEELGRPEEEIGKFKESAVKDMALNCRNAFGTKQLAEKFGYSKEDLKEIFSAYLSENEETADSIPDAHLLHERKYNPKLRKYFGFKEWLDFLLKEWDRLG